MAGLNLFTNNAATTLASNISNVATSLTVATGTGALFPNPTAGQYFYCTLANNAGTVEIIKVTARSGDTFSTITRAQDGTSAVGWTAGDKVELRLVNADLTNFPQLDSTNTFSQQQTMSNLTASKPVFTDSSKGLVSTGTVPTDQGGTGLTTFTAANNAIYSTSGSALTAGTLPIAAGGTGATTKTAAFDALAPTTTNGDMMYFNGTDVVRLGIGSTGQVLKVSGGIPTWGADLGGFTTMQIYTSGSGTWTIPSGITSCRITVVGGGGAGATAGNSANVGGGGGGGGGASIRYYTGLTPGNTINYTVGGAGGTSSVSSGTQSITTISATGGAAGTTSSRAGIGGAGGAGSGGDINFNGGGGGGGIGVSNASATAGAGGSSFFGGGARANGVGANSLNAAGIAGTAYGGGGSGGSTAGSVPGASGGAGAGGVVVIEY